MAKRRLDQLDVAGKRVLVRVDFNVPIDQGIEGIALYDQRLRATLPTIQYLIDQGSKIVLCSHLGRPNGEVVEGLRLAPVGDRLAMLLDRPVKSLPEITGPAVADAVSAMSPGDIILLENLRFHPGEEKNDGVFACELADTVDCFVMDAFAVAHRAHASTVGVAQRLAPAVAGFLMAKELKYLGEALTNPERPFVAILGGAKISGKIEVIEALLPRVDTIIIGGAMACTFFLGMGHEVGGSLVEIDKAGLANELLELAGSQLVLPRSATVSQALVAGCETREVPSDHIPAGWAMYDIGRAAAADFSKIISTARTVVWNGPMGVFETPPFDAGTRAVADALVKATARGATTVVGGGDSAAALAGFGLQHAVSHLSTGGGASLEFLEGKPLPAVTALNDA
ncbi:MAG: phosphoglycerate kinase [Gemmatimonadetes bacterium]|nr:phosphoglycerate kinase [Gemmatimonadota bacterium]